MGLIKALVISKQIYSNMKKLFFIISMLLLLASVRSVFAQNTFHDLRATTVGTATQSSNHKIFPTAAATHDATRISDLKSRADLEITRRLDALNKLITKINSFKRLSSAQKTELTTQIQTQIDGLSTLKTKIDADTDLLTLQTDVKSIITDYRIYVFFIEDINLIAAAERIGTVLDNMTILSGKLQTRIQTAQTNGSNVDELNTSYSDMQAKLTDATSLVGQVNSELTGLSASGYPGNKASLSDARTKLQQSYTDLKGAYQDGLQIIRLLKELKLFSTETPTPILTPTPTI